LIALVLVVLAWHNLYDLKEDLNIAIATEKRHRTVAANERHLARIERQAHRSQLDEREIWMSAANELLIKTSSKSWTTEDQTEYERLRTKLNPMLITPDYRKPVGERNYPTTPQIKR
jgi:hypothetical protein